MKLLTRFIFAILLVCSNIFIVSFFQYEACRAQPIKSGFIAWKIVPAKIEKKAVKPSYLVGTVHSITFPEYDFNTKMDEFMSSCEVFVMESGNSIFLSYNKTDIFLPGEIRLKDLMSPKNWEKLSSICIDNKIDGDCERYMPWYLAVLLTRPEIRKSESLIMDVYLQRKATARSLKIYYLETMVTYSLNKCPIEEQLAELEALVDDSREIESKTDEMIKIYNSGNHKKLYEIMIAKEKKDRRQTAVSTHANRILIDERNLSWLPELEKHINSGGAFIAVGTAHLVGDNGIIEMLKKKGYTVTDESVSGEEKYVYLSNPRMKEVPLFRSTAFVAELENLEELNLNYTGIKELPAEFTNFKKLSVQMGNNNLKLSEQQKLSEKFKNIRIKSGISLFR